MEPYPIVIILDSKSLLLASKIISTNLDAICLVPLTFDTILLTYGPRPFETVENDIDNFITLKGFEVPEEYDNLYDYLNTLINRQESTSDPNYIDSTIREDKKTDWKTYAVIGGAVVLAGLIVFIVRAKKKEGE